jgi:2-oxoglutarate ferredoxin oxidoreductase subunit gamma
VAERARTEIRFAGLGGQGVVAAGALLGEAATLAGLGAAGSSSYGSQARGGACRSDVVIAAPGAIDFPHVTRPDVLAVMSAEAYGAYLGSLAPEGIVLLDPYHVARDPAETHAHHEVEATRIALDAFSTAQAANIVMLGALAGLTGIVGEEHLREALRSAFAERFARTNARALELGLERGRALAGGAP